jgi:hypothetical protein
MLLQSYEGIIRIFPNWNHSKDASFEKLRAYGAFVVSSRLKKGRIEYVKLVSEKGRICLIENPWPHSRVKLVRVGKGTEIVEGDVLNFPTGENEVIQLTAI